MHFDGVSWIAANFVCGSWFLNGDGPEHLPSYRTVDLSVDRSFGENLSVKVTALNLTSKRYLIDLSNTFGGSHFANPHEVSLQVRYRFRYGAANPLSGMLVPAVSNDLCRASDELLEV